MRTIFHTVVIAAAFTLSGAAQDLVVQSGVPAAAFPRPDRPVADIVSPIWHDEKERDEAGLIMRSHHAWLTDQTAGSAWRI